MISFVRTKCVPLLKLAFIVLLAIYLVKRQEFLFSISQTLLSARLEQWVLASLAFAGTFGINAFRLWLLVRAQGLNASWSELCLDSIRGSALNAVSLIGVGEGYRSHRLASTTNGNLKLCAQLVLTDRLLGLAMVAAMAIVFLAAGDPLNGIEVPKWLPVVGTLLTVFALGASGWWLRTRPRRLLQLQTHHGYSKRTVLAIVTASVTSLGVWYASVYSLTLALGIEVPSLTLAYVAPLVTLSTLIPLSIGGLGIRETGYALLLAPETCSVAQASALGLLQYSTFLVVAMMGWGLLAFQRQTVRP